MRRSNEVVVAFLLVFMGFFVVLPSISVAEDDLDSEFMLEEVTVTAQKRQENKQKTAITMDVITGEDIKNLGRSDIDDILSTISSVSINKSADGYRVAIRGVDDYISPNYGQSITTPTVAINQDGVYSNSYDAGAFYDLERVEVLYGPQSTMYTSTSPGGVVNVVTASPKLDTFEASGSIEYGDYDLVHTEGVVNAPVTETFALRGAFTTSVHDAYLTNGQESTDDKAARIKGLYQPNERFSTVVSAEIQRTGGSGFSGGVTAFVDEGDVDDPWAEGVESGTLGYNDQTKEKLNAKIDWEFPIGALAVLPSYARGDGEWTMSTLDSDGSYYMQHAIQSSEERGMEIRFASLGDSDVTWIVGATYYESSDKNRRLSEEYDTTGEGYWALRTMEEEAYAVFGNLTYPVTDAFRATVGYRKSWDELVSINTEWTMSPLDGSIWTEYDFWQTENITENDGRDDYKVGVEYDLAENSMLYLDYSTSYRVQGGQSGGSWPVEELIAYTIGVKNRFLDNKLQVNLGAYYYDYQNFLARQMLMVSVDADEDGTTDYIISEPNANQFGDGRMIGFDLQASMVITSKDMLNLSVSFIDSEWTDLNFDYLYDQDYPDEDYRFFTDESYDGKPMKNTPPWTINAGYNHMFNLGNGATINARIDAKYQTGYRLTWHDDDYPYNYQEEHFTGDISFGYTPPTTGWTLSAYVKNVTDYAEKRSYISGMSSSTLSISDPRTWGVIWTVKY